MTSKGYDNLIYFNGILFSSLDLNTNEFSFVLTGAATGAVRGTASYDSQASN